MSRGAVRTLVACYPDWPLVAAEVDASVPVIVVAANRVVALSDAAREEGVERGLRRREAQGRCPGLQVVEADPSREARRWLPVVVAVESFALGVEILAPGTLALATRGPSRYFGGDQALADKVAATVDQVARVPGAGTRVGVADGRFAAHLAAQLGRTQVIPPGASRTWLSPLPVSTLDIPELTELLVRLGIRTLGALAELPPSSVLSRFGPVGARAHRLARGLDDQPLAGRTPPPELATQAELDPPAEQVDRVAFVAKALADELHQSLADRGLACTRVSIEAETEHGEHLARQWRHDGALDAGAIAERVRWQLDSWLIDRAGSGGTTGGLTLLRLVPDEVRPDLGRQLGFWGGATDGDRRVGRVLARVQGMLGPYGVMTGVVGGGRDPGDQVRLVPWGDPREPARPGLPRTSPPQVEHHRTTPGVASVGTRGEVPPWPGRLPGPAPSVLHRPPRRADVFDADRQPVEVTGRGVVSSPPAAVVIATGAPAAPVVATGSPVAVIGWGGPWPVEERWWDPTGRRRARFQVALADGSAHLLVREGGRWWVEATYD